MTDQTLVNDTRLADLQKAAAKLGSESVNGDLAKPKLAIAVLTAAADGVTDEADVPVVFDKYQKAREASQARNTMAAANENPNSYKANLSKLTQIDKVGRALGHVAVEMFDKAKELRDEMLGTDAKLKPMFDAYVDIARAQLKTPTEPLHVDDIAALLRKPDAASKDLLDKIIGDYKNAYRHREQLLEEQPSTEENPNVAASYLTDAINALADTIQALDGAVPPMSKDEKKQAEVAAFLAKQGFKVVKVVADETTTPEVTA